MKNVLLAILKEIGIAIVLIVILIAAVVIAFRDKLPYDEVIPSGEEYVRANMKTYSVSSTDRISEINAVTITHETNQGQIIAAENEVRIQTGKYTPFGTISGTTDLPSERVGVTVEIPNSSDNDEQSDGVEKVEYPEVGQDLIEDATETKTVQEAASSRMNNVVEE